MIDVEGPTVAKCTMSKVIAFNQKFIDGTICIILCLTGVTRPPVALSLNEISNSFQVIKEEPRSAVEPVSFATCGRWMFQSSAVGMIGRWWC